MLEDDVAESYVNSEGKVFTKEEIRKGIESKKPLLLICDGVPIKGIIDMMKFMRVEGSGRFFFARTLAKFYLEHDSPYVHDPMETIWKPLFNLKYEGESILSEIAEEETEKRRFQDFIGDSVFDFDNFGFIHHFLDLQSIDIKIRIQSAYRNRKKLSEIYVENPEKRARRFMAQYQHLIFPNHSMSRFHNQKASLMAELAEKNRTDPRGSDPVYWEYERAVQSIDYSQGAIFGHFFVFGRRKIIKNCFRSPKYLFKLFRLPTITFLCILVAE